MTTKFKVTLLIESTEESDPGGVLEWFENALTYDIGDFRLDPEAEAAGEAITVEQVDQTLSDEEPDND